MLKDNGFSKKKKYVKCECKEKIEVCEENLEHIGSVLILTCPICEKQIVLN